MILNAANDVIKNNRNRTRKKLWTENQMGSETSNIIVLNRKVEANYIAERLYIFKWGTDKYT